MEYSRFLDCLAADFARLQAVVPIDLTAAVPNCPGWTVADLTRHVGEVSRRPRSALKILDCLAWSPGGRGLCRASLSAGQGSCTDSVAVV